jgi:hypothetical protein
MTGRTDSSTAPTPVLSSTVRQTLYTFLVLLLFLPGKAQAQGLPSDLPGDAKENHVEGVVASNDVAPAYGAGHQEEHPRLFWIIPTYSVSNSKLPSLLSPHDKFRMFVKNATDPYTLGYTAFTAGLAHANDDLAGYGQGATGYGKRLGAGLADEASAGFFTTFLFPSLLHQDPRYFRQGSGPFKRRLAHAVMRPMVTRKDSGERAFNWSGLLGSIAASSLSNAYYPPGDRGVGLTFTRVGWGIPSGAIDHLIDEFGPDLERRFLHRGRNAVGHMHSFLFPAVESNSQNTAGTESRQ